VDIGIGRTVSRHSLIHFLASTKMGCTTSVGLKRLGMTRKMREDVTHSLLLAVSSTNGGVSLLAEPEGMRNLFGKKKGT
jgi:hypothetical protein